MSKADTTPERQVPPVPRRPPAAAVSALFEHLTRRLHSASFSEGLNPAQWNALRYLARADASARTVTAFSRHHMTKKSAASETMAALTQKGLVKTAVDPNDARSKSLDLTPAGRHLLESDPLRALVNALEKLSDENMEAVAIAMELLLREVFMPADPSGDRARDKKT